MGKFGKLALGALSAAVMLGGAVGAHAQVDSDFSAVLDNTDPTWANNYFGSQQPCNIVSDPGTVRRYETRQVNIAIPGTYNLLDEFNPVDAGLGIYSGPFDPASPSTGCLVSSEDSLTATLAAGTYTIVLTSLNPGLGNVTYRFSGPGAVTLVAPTAVPTLSEWAMILFGTILAGGAALYIQRRKLSA